jgi:hypothetical protein
VHVVENKANKSQLFGSTSKASGGYKEIVPCTLSAGRGERYDVARLGGRASL